MNYQQLRSRIAYLIVFGNVLLIAMTVLYYLLRGFDTDEFTATLTLLTAVTALYIGSLLQYLGRNTKQTIASIAKVEYKSPKILLWVIVLHFVLIAIILSLKAFTQITFREMNLLLAFVESVFGAYMGQIITSLFNNNPQSTQKEKHEY